MDNTLYLHIGFHKTASTSIQQAMMKNEVSLGEGNTVFFTKMGPNKCAKGNSGSWLYWDMQGDESGARIYESFFTEMTKLGKLGQNVIVSAEDFAWVFEEREIHRLASCVYGCFSSVKVIAFVRRQDKQLLSHFQQASRGPTRGASLFYGNDLKPTPEYKPKFDLYLDYEAKFDLWSRHFSDVDVVSFDSVLDRGDDPVQIFFDLVGIKCRVKQPAVNESMGFNHTYLSHLMTMLKVSPYVRREVLRSVPDFSRVIISHELSKNIMEQYQYSNTRFASRFCPDFLKYTNPQNFSGLNGQMEWTYTDLLANTSSLLHILNRHALYFKLVHIYTRLKQKIMGFLT